MGTAMTKGTLDTEISLLTSKVNICSKTLATKKTGPEISSKCGAGVEWKRQIDQKK